EAPGDGELAQAWPSTLERYGRHLEACLLHDALADLWEFVGLANRTVDAQQPWALAKAAKSGDEAAAQRLRGVLGELLEANRLLALAGARFMPTAAARAVGQLGLEYPYGPDGNGGPVLTELLAWGREQGTGRIATPEPLFPRLETAEG